VSESIGSRLILDRLLSSKACGSIGVISEIIDEWILLVSDDVSDGVVDRKLLLW
jgi:hypothetical protein